MSGFSILQKIVNVTETVITELAVAPLGVLAGGVAGLAAICFTLWLLYRAYQILGGWAEASVPTILRDATIVYVILAIAGGVGAYQSNVQNLLKETPIKMASDLTGETSSLKLIEDKLIVAFDGLDKLSEETPPPQDDPYEANFKGDLKRNAAALWNKVISPLKAIPDAFKKAFGVIMTFIKLMIILAGLMYMAIVITKVLLITKIGLMLSLGFGPLFVMAAAFKQTRGWFNGWLNMTLGFGMSYVVIMFCTKILLTILDKLWFDGTSWITVFSSLFVCIALSIVIARMGDIASAWFGAGNIADGTAAAAAWQWAVWAVVLKEWHKLLVVIPKTLLKNTKTGDKIK
ncbi:MAG: type IV secretion system protein [Neisseriaceae bacterium]|nr:type IV secretion system protein [Neisseriaceae bacterium]